MNKIKREVYDWTIDDLVEVDIKKENNFNIIIETLSRIGICNDDKKELYPSCHILHKKGKYYIVHFLELYSLDNRNPVITEEDMMRRNLVISLLLKWGLISIINFSRFYFLVDEKIIPVNSFVYDNDYKKQKIKLHEILYDDRIREELNVGKMSKTRIIKNSEKEEWNIIPKYLIGKENPDYCDFYE